MGNLNNTGNLINQTEVGLNNFWKNDFSLFTIEITKEPTSHIIMKQINITNTHKARFLVTKETNIIEIMKY